ncbi:dienelactone hydrolase family protein [Lignipirellula cremea]|uniref:Abhydrolase family protein n=1 Tax=Lignipirellula cremea TaxID=2528010 RepID=A0A518DMB7_9BACT|nr:alpha/beta hydrolase family protein [Lignipirellula cremea]QDU92986.1 Abhydrolase family protein [Lignipirellula cremea]
MTKRRDFLKSLGAGSMALAMGPGQPARAAETGDITTPADGPPLDMPRELQPLRANMGSLYPYLKQIAGQEDYPDSFLSDRFPTLEAFKKNGRERVQAAFSYQPPRVAPEAEVLHRQDCGDFIREKILFSTSPDFRIAGYVHIPKNLKGPAPAIVDLHSHGGMFLFGKEKVIDFGQNHPVMTRYHEKNYGGRPTTTALVRRGYVVITIDALMFGERRLMLDEDLHYGWERSKYSVEVATALNQKCRGKESTLAKSMVYAGAAWPGVITWDDRRTVDYLVTRPEVDPQRIGCVGVSLGGWRTLFLAGMEERISAACLVGFMSTVRPMLHRHIDTHSWAHFVPGLHPYLDLPDVVSMMAPKPLMVQQCRQDGLFTPEGMQDSVDKIAAVYEKAGVKEQFHGNFYDGGHRFDVPMQEDAFDFFDQQLRG